MRNILIIVIAVAVVLIGLCVGLAEFITNYLWFRDIGQTDVFWKKLLTQIEIGVPTFVVLTVLSAIYLRALEKGYRKRVTVVVESTSSKIRTFVKWGISIVASGIIAYMTITRLWFGWLQFTNATSFNIADPIFNNDISFYVFRLQFIRDLNSLVIMAIIAFAAITFVYYFFLLSVAKPKITEGDPAPEPEEDAQPGSPFGQSSDMFGGALGGLFKSFGLGGQSSGQTTQRPKQASSLGDSGNLKELLNIASKQIAILGIIFFIMVGVNYFLKQFDLLYSSNGVVFGAGFTDINITLWVYRLIMVLSVVAAVMFAIGVTKKKVKTMLAVPVAMIVIGLLGSGVGMLTQQLVVSPDEINKENHYLGHNIEYTQMAYGLRDVTIKPFPAENTLTSEDIANNIDTIRNIRINDYDPAKTFYNSTQTIRQYYTFNDVDVDRYMINGAYTQTFLSAREIDETKIPQQWLNMHLKYTHGYGITLSRVDKVTASGQPDIMIKDIPPVSQVEEIDITRPEIYFGELQNQYIVVNTDEEEFDYPEGDSNVYTTYEGNTGIRMNMFNRLMFAIKEQSMQLLVSTNISGDSKIIVNRNIAERVQTIMPYLSYSSPYMVTVDGKLYWITDAYTTSDNYPYSEPYGLDAGARTNYIRNSVKVVIDAYTGETTYYIVDPTDPVVTTMSKIYPKLFTDISAMPDGIKAHLRYPSDMLTIQANIYKKYHVNDITVFYQGEDRWDIANEKVGALEKEVPMTPNYYIMKLPGEKSVEFINSIPYTPMNKVNMTALLIARNDGENYGELLLLQLPKGKIVMGPSQIDAQISQDTNISRDFSLWANSDSTYQRGNMFVIPIENSIMYVEPIYLRASDASLPEVKRIIIYYGDRIAYEETLAKALDTMFGPGTGDIVAGDDPTGDQGDADSGSNDTPPGDAQQQSTDELIKLAVAAYNNAVEAQKAGDWTRYGNELRMLEYYLNRLMPQETVEIPVDADTEGTDAEGAA